MMSAFQDAISYYVDYIKSNYQDILVAKEMYNNITHNIFDAP